MITVPITNSSLYALVDDEDYRRIMNYSSKWFLESNGYVRSCRARPFRLMLHQAVFGPILKGELDHFNRNKLDCRKENLRNVSHAVNQSNKDKRKSASSKYRGVYFHKTSRKWVVCITHNHKSHANGSYDSEEEAKIKANELILKLKGNNAVIN